MRWHVRCLGKADDHVQGFEMDDVGVTSAEPACSSADDAGERRRLETVTAGRYEIQAEIGRGGMSRVFRAWDPRGHRLVAIKLLAAGLSMSVEHRERFRREASITSRLAHPNILACYDFVRSGDVVFAVMPYVAGSSLAERLAGGVSLSPAAMTALLMPLADALACAHASGVVHRDVKPANILLRAADGRPFLTDFGIATLRTSEHSRGEVAKRFGTPEFMSPEQALGAWDADHRSDIYSLGLIAFLALAGRMPFPGGSPLAQVAQRSVLDAPPLRQVAPAVPGRLAAVVDRCLARAPKRRWRSAAALGRALERAGQPRPGPFGRWWSILQPVG